MRKPLISFSLMLIMFVCMLPIVTLPVYAADPAPTALWVASSETNGIPAKIDVFVSKTETSGTGTNRTYTYTCMLFLPGNVNPSNCFLSWEGNINAASGNASYASGACPVPAKGNTITYSFSGSPKRNYKITTYQGTESIQSVFIEIDESQGTIEAMNNDENHETSCTGEIYINGQWLAMPKIKGRGNYTWKMSKDKKTWPNMRGSLFSYF